MSVFLNISIILCCIFIAYQDIKQRKVLLLVLLGLISLVTFKAILLAAYLEVALLECFINLVIISLMVLLLWIYFKLLRKKQLTDVLGLGDILMFVVFAIAFSAVTFIIHLTLSFVFSLMFHLILKKHYKKENTVPLAGFMSIYLIGLLLVESVEIKIPFLQ